MEASKKFNLCYTTIQTHTLPQQPHVERRRGRRCKKKQFPSIPLHTTHRHSPSPQTRRDSNQKFRDFETSFDVSQVGLQYAHEL